MSICPNCPNCPEPESAFRVILAAVGETRAAVTEVT